MTAVPTPAAVPPAQLPERIEPIAGTEFGVAYLRVPPTVSGLAVGSLVAGIASILAAGVVVCLGLALAQAGGAIGAGAIAVPAAVLGLGGVGLGLAAMRQVSRAPARVAGRGMAIAGLVCGGVGALGTAGGFLIAVALLANLSTTGG